ncbi:NADase-type glycan-binding domain-containing protein [Streptomyces vinaceus]|uniref:NADase-type glycan-binding domain-containing protein n=1 Tax=Streptomyces vinaceus TaxID=1960 RepID=UPI0035DB23AE
MTRQTPGTGTGAGAGARRDGTGQCAECGTRAEPDQPFCDSCGAVLGWADRADATGGAAERDPACGADEPSGTDGAPGTTGSAPSAPPAPAAPAQATQATQAAQATATTSMLTAAVAPASDDAAARARSLLVPVADPEPREAAAPSVAPVLPGRSVADRPQVRTPGRETGVEGGPPCPWCATPNRPDRHFCGVCAMPLSGSPEAPGRRPWWRRVLDFRNRETPWAGDRPRLRRGFGYLMTWALWALVLTLLIAAIVHADTAVNAVRDHFARRTPVGPDAVEASHSYPGNDPQLAFDKLNNTWWGPGVSQSGAGEWVEARFDQPTRLLDVIITPGVSTRADKLSQSALPRHVEAVITTSDGRTSTRVLTLDQAAGGQRRTFRAADVTSVRFVLRSAYAAAADKQVALAEIEFFGPSNSSRSQ